MAFQFNPVDLTQMRLLAQLSPAQRLRTMLDAREMVASLKRGRLRRRYPELSSQEINLKLLEELARAQPARPRP
jgi:hypothetical protein